MSAETPTDIGTLIVSTPGVQGGLPCIAGTRVPVREIATLHREGFTVDAIAAEFPDVPSGYLHAAIAYYLVNREQIDAELDDEAAEYERLAREHRRAAS